MKRCTVCKIEKDLSEFYKQAAGALGVMGQCKECRKKTVAEYENKNRDKKKKKDRELYLRQREQRLKKAKEWNAEKRKEYQRAYRARKKLEKQMKNE